MIVIGAGINGAGVARDVAVRGLRVLLLDKGDISSGTTRWEWTQRYTPRPFREPARA